MSGSFYGERGPPEAASVPLLMVRRVDVENGVKPGMLGVARSVLARRVRSWRSMRVRGGLGAWIVRRY